MAPWIYFKTLRRRPIVLTIASEKGEVVPEFLQRCRVIAVQTIGMEKRLEEFGSDECRVQLVYPGIDLTAFRPRPRTAHARRPKVLLATFPRSTEELDSRGVRFLLSAAAALPDVDFILLTRPWRSGGTAAAQVGQEIESAGLRNVTLLSGTQTDMNKVYSGADFTIIPYTAPDGGKECPRSLIESMACGVPVLISDVAPFSRFVEAQDCGAVFRLQPEALGAALERGLQRYEHVSARAVTCAGSFFNIHATFERYAKIYDSVT
jgi:glycosyltransferase involved in cell wall biosynthesis